MQPKAPITAVIITKNEGMAIRRCLEAASFCDQILVVDSRSGDETVAIALELGADVVDFTWNGEYPKKKQWGMDHPLVRHDWVLHLDADEVVGPDLRDEITAIVSNENNQTVAYDIPLAYHFMSRELRFGHRVTKRSLVDRRHARFPEVGDLRAPGITEVEGHYQPVASGAIGNIRSRLHHDDPDPLSDWIARHNRYSDWEAYLGANPEVRQQVRDRRSRHGRTFDRLPFKPLVFFLYGYLLRGGFLDRRPGLDYAIALTWYYWLIDAKKRDSAQRLAGSPSTLRN